MPTTGGRKTFYVCVSWLVLVIDGSVALKKDWQGMFFGQEESAQASSSLYQNPAQERLRKHFRSERNAVWLAGSVYHCALVLFANVTVDGIAL